ncbi:hypothetical protein C7974DRAFT_425601 [Boeremia exigua]|uniref:uncharacterized protein n=1 Tax=Boeremia exigua TaxID=749465 RepID=UPI001E8CE114|nr:uncharacterized protein C7974DRAFT_425601 [Boeremia exigua]KAH6621838.1 hypothetical protein C7974DRAFT_425601 [Boeremia exigua]
MELSDALEDSVRRQTTHSLYFIYTAARSSGASKLCPDLTFTLPLIEAAHNDFLGPSNYIALLPSFRPSTVYYRELWSNLKRATTPPPSDRVDLTPPQTPGAPQDALPRTLIPPSPGGPRLASLNASFKDTTRLHAPPLGGKRSQTAGVRKATSKGLRNKSSLGKSFEAIAESKKTTNLMDLPGELRNLIYSYSAGNSRQALLVHRPRIASLRPRTRLDRHRTLESDVLEQKHDEALATATSKHMPKTVLLARETNRPFFGLTQVCRQLRQEFRPLYMQSQEIGMDLVEVASYLSTFYPGVADHLKVLSTSGDRKIDMPFTGNMTIAVGDRVKQIERSADGIDVGPLLDVWANSFKIEAGFGRYMQVHYDATSDGEAKDLYRLFGRRVQQDRRCSVMNYLWRNILRTRSLASVHIHRRPAAPAPAYFPVSSSQTVRFRPLHMVSVEPRPYIHVLFKPECAETWMTKLDSQIPYGWLAAHGFDAMEYFDVKVGVASSRK